MTLPEIIVYSKPDCCLCEEVKEQLKKLQTSHQFVWREINILEDPAASKRFRYEIPVIFVDGQKAFTYHLDENRFIQLLQAAGTERRGGTQSPR